MSSGSKHKHEVTDQPPEEGLAAPPTTKRMKPSLSEFAIEDEKRKLRRRYDGEEIQLTAWERAMLEQFPDVLRNGVFGICLLIAAMRREPVGTILSVHNITPPGYRCGHSPFSDMEEPDAENCQANTCAGYQRLDAVPHANGLYFCKRRSIGLHVDVNWKWNDVDETLLLWPENVLGEPIPTLDGRRDGEVERVSYGNDEEVSFPSSRVSVGMAGRISKCRFIVAKHNVVTSKMMVFRNDGTLLEPPLYESNLDGAIRVSSLRMHGAETKETKLDPIDAKSELKDSDFNEWDGDALTYGDFMVWVTGTHLLAMSVSETHYAVERIELKQTVHGQVLHVHGDTLFVSGNNESVLYRISLYRLTRPPALDLPPVPTPSISTAAIVAV